MYVVMENALWVEKHNPSLSDIRQENARGYLEESVGEKMNMLVYGPEGVGKTASVRAWGEATHDNMDNDFMVVNASDFFNRSKKEIRNDDRFGHFLRGQTEFSKQYRSSGDASNKYKRNWSKRDMLCHVLKELAGYDKSGNGFKTLVIDNASDMRVDFQQALRRIVENNHQTTQFIIIAESKADIIPAIQSRCTPVPFREPTTNELTSVLEKILDKEGIEYDDDVLGFLAGYSDHDVRKALLTAQTVAAKCDRVTQNNVVEQARDIGYDAEIKSMISDASNGELSDARSVLDDLLIDDGLSGEEVLQLIASHVHATYTGEKQAALVTKISEVDMLLSEGDNERVHLMNLLTEFN